MLVTGRDVNSGNAQCYGFQKWGDLASNCPNNNKNCQHQGQGRGKKGTSLFQVIVGFAHNKDQYNTPCPCILLDVCSNISIINNVEILG